MTCRGPRAQRFMITCAAESCRTTRTDLGAEGLSDGELVDCCIRVAYVGKWIQPWTKDHKSISLSKSPQREVISISLSLMRSSRPDVPVGPSFGNSKYLHFPPFPALVFANEEFFGISSCQVGGLFSNSATLGSFFTRVESVPHVI